MDVELFVHGVPSGEGFWGKDDDRKYFGTFYDHSTDTVKFLIQTRALQGKTYCYYNYLVYKTPDSPVPNVVANDGRDGSYFGISLRLDAYCKNMGNMFRLLDYIYNTYILGHLLKTDKAKLKYAISDFANASATLKNTEQNLLQMLQNAFSADDFMTLQGFATGGGSYPSCNLYDCINESVMATMKQYGKIAISPYYPSAKEAAMQKQCDNQILAVRQQCDEQIKAHASTYEKEKQNFNEKLAAAGNQIAELQNSISQKEKNITLLNNQITKLREEQAAQAKKKIHGVVVEGGNDNSGKKPSIVKMLLALIPLLNLLLLVLIFLMLLKPGQNDSENTEESETTEQQVTATKENRNKSGLQIEEEPTKVEDDTDTTDKDFNIDKVEISIKNFNGGKLKMHQFYTIEAKNGAANGKWTGTGFNPQLDPNVPNVMIMEPISQKVVIKYQVGGKQKTLELEAEQ